MLLLSPAWAQPKVVVFSRHTFRSVGSMMGPKRVQLPDQGIDWLLPNLGYGMDATRHGLDLARDFGAPALQRAAELAVSDLDGGVAFDHRWDEIRPDLSCSRDFMTGLYVREGLQAGQATPIEMAGCPTRDGLVVDGVTNGSVLRDCIPTAEFRRAQAEGAHLQQLQTAADQLLELVSGALGGPAPRPMAPLLDAAGNVHPDYDALWTLASSIEMAADGHAPLARLFPQAASRPTLQAAEALAVTRATRYLGALFAAYGPLEVAYASATLPTRWIESLPGGYRAIAVSHDDDLALLVRALEIVREESPIDEFTMMPMESFVFALDDRRVSVVRTRMTVNPQGWFAGPFSNEVIWHGSRAEWLGKLRKIEEHARTWAPGAAARAAVPLLPVQTMKVLPAPR